MRHTVKIKQPNSKMCFVCGLKNVAGLHSFFYELDNDELLAVFKPQEAHQGYPGRLHGGIATAILDETIGRAITITNPQTVWGVTMEITVRFKHPVPLDEEVRVVGRVIKDTRLYFEGSGEILLKDGTVAVTGRGKYLKLPIEKIAEFDETEEEWRVVSAEDDPQEVEL
ncbi:MAG TPA: PaaI family thioesterase [Anaerolineae bacterium]|nr:PaaI family thioesterase [Anaerolineae bacterium]